MPPNLTDPTAGNYNISTKTVANYSMSSVSGLFLHGNGSNLDGLPAIAFSIAMNTVDAITNAVTINKEIVATIQAEDKNGYVADIVFYTKIGNSAVGSLWSAGSASKAYERLRIFSNAINETGRSVRITGICEATAGFNVSSSLKYKTNISELPENYNLDMLMQYRPIIYNLKSNDENSSKNPKFIPGFIAEDIDKMGGSLFIYYKDGEPDSLDYSRICVHIIKAIQELKTNYDSKIEDLKNTYESKIEDLQQQINEIKQKLATL